MTPNISKRILVYIHELIYTINCITGINTWKKQKGEKVLSKSSG